jgi:hypothetical protein
LSTDTPFRRMPGRRRGVLRRASVWDAGEYLLSVNGTAFSERYRRYYYRDIKAIVVQNGVRLGSAGALLLLILTCLFLIGMATVPGIAPLAKWLWTAPLFVMTWLVYADVARSCRVFVYTAVSSEELPGIFRRSAARRTLPLILEKVYAAQGQFVYNEPLEPETPVVPPAAAPVTKWSAVSRQGLYASLFFWLAALASAAFAFWYSDTLLTPRSLTLAKILFSVSNALAALSGIWALVKFSGVKRVSRLRNVLLAGLLFSFARAYALYFTFAGIRVSKGQLTDTMRLIHWRHGFGTVDCAVSIILGAAGLILLLYAWQSERQEPASRGVLSSL